MQYDVVNISTKESKHMCFLHITFCFLSLTITKLQLFIFLNISSFLFHNGLSYVRLISERDFKYFPLCLLHLFSLKGFFFYIYCFTLPCSAFVYIFSLFMLSFVSFILLSLVKLKSCDMIVELIQS